MKYQLVGLRPSGDWENGHSGTGRKVLAILRSPSGKRTTAEVGKDDCKTFASLRKAIVRALSKDGIRRITETDIEEPPAHDLPWDEKTLDDIAAGRVPKLDVDRKNARATVRGLDCSSPSAAYGQRDCVGFAKSNAQYLAEIGKGEAQFSSPEAIQAKIDLNKERMADAHADLLEAAVDLVTREQRDALLALTPLGQSVLANRGH